VKKSVIFICFGSMPNQCLLKKNMISTEKVDLSNFFSNLEDIKRKRKKEK
jgi:hypothetical protein